MIGDPRSLLLVAVGGSAGAGARWAVVAGTTTGADFPWWTLLVNLLGCFGLGLLVRASRRTALLLGTGFCGGLTTFSTFSVELAELLDDGEAGVAVAYLAVSVAAGLAAVAAGRRVATA